MRVHEIIVAMLGNSCQFPKFSFIEFYNNNGLRQTSRKRLHQVHKVYVVAQIYNAFLVLPPQGWNFASTTSPNSAMLSLELRAYAKPWLILFFILEQNTDTKLH